MGRRGAGHARGLARRPRPLQPLFHIPLLLPPPAPPLVVKSNEQFRQVFPRGDHGSRLAAASLLPRPVAVSDVRQLLPARQLFQRARPRASLSAAAELLPGDCSLVGCGMPSVAGPTWAPLRGACVHLCCLRRVASEPHRRGSAGGGVAPWRGRCPGPEVELFGPGAGPPRLGAARLCTPAGGFQHFLFYDWGRRLHLTLRWLPLSLLGLSQGPARSRPSALCRGPLKETAP